MTNNNKQILVVEDDEAIRSLIVETLLDEGYRVVSVDRATTALTLLSQQSFDLITLDLGLPEMSGNEFLKELSRRNKNYATIPVIVVSANANQLVASPQVKEVVPKPFDLFNLITIVHQYA